MTETLQVRIYNVRFGDAILVSVPDRKVDGTTSVRHMLIDFGNALSTQGGDDVVFEPVIRDIMSVLDGRPVDLYVMTHEHLDHVQGLKYGAERLQLTVPVTRVWLTASANPGYYDTHEKAKKRRLDALNTYHSVRRFLAASSQDNTAYLEHLLENNDVMLRGDLPDTALEAAGSTSRTEECVQLLRTMGRQPPAYVHREFDIAGVHPFEEARLRVLAPEEDTSVYYGRFQPMALGDVRPGNDDEQSSAPPLPPAGVDAGAFFDLVDTRRRGLLENLLAIDAANNNTSLVLLLEWRGWRLLFPGDAEVRSWKEMNKRGLLEPIHFLKIGHHGSANGTPQPPLLDAILPPTSPDGQPRRAVVSTFEDSYEGVPDRETLKTIGNRVDELISTEGMADGDPILVEFS